jgi:hypothetical protein
MATDTNLPDGVYIGLDFATYLAQRGRKGSTDKSSLAKHREGYWWASSMNPYFVPTEHDYQVEGEAIHALLLEGLYAYESRFIVAPDKTEYPEALFTIDQIKARLEKAHIPTSKLKTKAEFVDAALVHLPEVPVWDSIMAAFDKVRGDRKPIGAETDFGIRAMWEAATDDRPESAEVRALLTTASKFPILAEVSVLYTDAQGVKHRARFDKVLPIYTLELKSVGNWEGRELLHKVDGLIKDNGYDIQLADYQIARRIGFAMVRESEANLHGGTPEERTHLMAMAQYDAAHPKPGWAWLFFQKPDSKGRAPVLFPVRETWAGPYHRSGFRKRQRALALYHDCMQRFGLAKPWSRVEPVHYTTEAHQPHITQSHYGWDEDPVEGEAEEMDQ